MSVYVAFGVPKLSFFYREIKSGTYPTISYSIYNMPYARIHIVAFIYIYMYIQELKVYSKMYFHFISQFTSGMYESRIVGKSAQIAELWVKVHRWPKLTTWHISVKLQQTSRSQSQKVLSVPCWSCQDLVGPDTWLLLISLAHLFLVSSLSLASAPVCPQPIRPSQ